MTTRTQDGTPVDWQKAMGDILRVRESDASPSDPYVSVSYRGRWFYISNHDTASKTTFSMLTQLLALRAGDVRAAAPLLTLPVAR